MTGRELGKELEEIERKMLYEEMGTIEWIRMEERIWELEEMLRWLSVDDRDQKDATNRDP